MAEGREQGGWKRWFRRETPKSLPQEAELDVQEREIKKQLRGILEESPFLDTKGQPIRTVRNGSIEAQLYTSPHYYCSHDELTGDYEDVEGIVELHYKDDKGVPFRLSYQRAIFESPTKSGISRQIKEDLMTYVYTENAGKQGDSLAQSEVVPRWNS